MGFRLIDNLIYELWAVVPTHTHHREHHEPQQRTGEEEEEEEERSFGPKDGSWHDENLF